MVISLQSRASLPLGQDNDSIQDLVELAQVKEPAVESKTLIPQSSNIRSVRCSILAQKNR